MEDASSTHFAWQELSLNGPCHPEKLTGCSPTSITLLAAKPQPSRIASHRVRIMLLSGFPVSVLYRFCNFWQSGIFTLYLRSI
jgi:hypothetical protein